MKLDKEGGRYVNVPSDQNRARDAIGAEHSMNHWTTTTQSNRSTGLVGLR